MQRSNFIDTISLCAGRGFVLFYGGYLGLVFLVGRGFLFLFFIFGGDFFFVCLGFFWVVYGFVFLGFFCAVVCTCGCVLEQHVQCYGHSSSSKSSLYPSAQQ